MLPRLAIGSSEEFLAVQPADGDAPTLEVRLLGNLGAWLGSKRIELPRSRKARALFAYICVAQGSVARETLCTLLFDSVADPKGSLRWSISRLRAALEASADQLIISNGRLAVSKLVRSDVARLADIQRRSHPPLKELILLEERIEGGFLDDLSLPECSDFETWRLAMRSSCAKDHANLLRLIIKRVDDRLAAVRYARRLVSVSRNDEQAWATLITQLRLAGNNREAREAVEIAHRELDREGVPLAGILRDAIGAMSATHSPTAAGHVLSSGQGYGIRPSLLVQYCQSHSRIDVGTLREITDGVFAAATRVKSCIVIAPDVSGARSVDTSHCSHDLSLRGVVSVRSQCLDLRVDLVDETSGTSVFDWLVTLHPDGNEPIAYQVTRHFSSRFEVDFALALITFARQKPAVSRSPWDLYYLSLPRIYSAQGYDPDAAMSQLNSALELNPDLGPALCALAWVRSTHKDYNSEPEALEETSRLARRSIEICQDDAFILGWASVVIAHTERELSAAQDIAVRALRLNPHSPMALIANGFITHYAGSYTRSLELIDLVDEDHAGGPLSFLIYTCRAMSLYQLDRFEEAAETARRAVGHNPSFIICLRFLAASLARLGRQEESKSLAMKMRQLDVSERLIFFKTRSPYASEEAVKKLCRGLELAGLPM